MDPIHFLAHAPRDTPDTPDTPESIDRFFAENGCETLLTLRRLMRSLCGPRPFRSTIVKGIAEIRRTAGFVPGTHRG